MARVVTELEGPMFLAVLRRALAADRSVPEQIREYVHQGLAADMGAGRPGATIREASLALPAPGTKNETPGAVLAG
jgi:hypothetical protein